MQKLLRGFFSVPATAFQGSEMKIKKRNGPHFLPFFIWLIMKKSGLERAAKLYFRRYFFLQPTFFFRL